VDNARQAIEAVNTHRPSIAIIDHGLPGTDGITLGQQIKQSDRGDQIKLMLFSGSLDADMKARADAAGFEDYLIKPVRMNELKNRLDQLESGHRN
jgi:DNA-binding response OmpR family regulator